MPRPLRFHVPGGLVEVTNRTFQGRLLLRPSKRLNEVFLGVLGRAQRQHAMEIVAAVCLSSHFHLLLRPRDSEQLAEFMRFFTTNLTKKVNRLTGWRGTMFDRRYTSILISDEPAAMIARLEYLLSNSVKEELVMAPGDWPGVESATALRDGSMTLDGGLWFDGRKAQAARQRGEDVDCFDFPEPETVYLSRLPCWEHLDDATYRERCAEMVRKIEEDAWRRHAREGTRPAGAHWVLQQDPQSRPRKLSHSPRPMFHAATREARKLLEEAYRWFVVAFREARERQRRSTDPHGFPPAPSHPPRPSSRPERRDPFHATAAHGARDEIGVFGGAVSELPSRRGPGARASEAPENASFRALAARQRRVALRSALAKRFAALPFLHMTGTLGGALPRRRLVARV